MPKNLLTTIGGIMAGFGTIPIALGTAHVHMPSWLYVTCISLAAMGPVLIGVAATDARNGTAQTPPAPPAPPPAAQNAAEPPKP